ncbi:MAG: hypothetical protein ACRDBO_19755 [Lachnospiraceae bacterium]
MKKILKGILIIIGVIIGTIISAFSLLVFFALISPKEKSQGNSSITIELNQNDYMAIANKPDPVYADTKEEALKANPDYYFVDYPHMANVSNVIKLFENDDYATMVYQSRNESVEGYVISKFHIKMVNEKKQYGLILVSLVEASDGRRLKFENGVRNQAPLYDFMADFSIVEGYRFFWGSTNSEKIKTLKIEGQSPDEIIEYVRLGKPEYFWYYENLISDKPSSEYEIEIGE